MKIAVVHDNFAQFGGAERVVEEIYGMFPQASLFAAVALEECMPSRLKDVPVNTSWMQRLPGIKEYFRLYFLLYPLAMEALPLSEYDLVLSSCFAYAKGVQARRDAIHVCYCHTPARWIWNYENYSGRASFGRMQRAMLPTLMRGLRLWDEGASRQPDHFVANSRAVADRIRQAYQRPAEVIHPPIDIERFHPCQEREDYYIILSRLVPYKRIDLAVKACTERKKRLLVIGDGPDRRALEAMAGPSVQFLGRASDKQVEYHVCRCRALLFPGEEDFGMAPLEVAAAGRPTIAYRAGGALETIVENFTGLFFDEQTPEALGDAIATFERQQWSSHGLRQHAKAFGVPVFQDRFRSFLQRVGVPLAAAESLASAPRTFAAVAGGGAS
ncbi:MAG: glycosyltransferase [Candidatus Sulfotelmatobacter sp.]|jgi:glycosyltransferase involved in cell wall biosynthesis